jgi:hypothetical protein
MSKISYCSLEEAWGNSYKKEEEEVKITKVDKVENNNSMVEYEKYRFNPVNKVDNNNYEKTYSPFHESIEKKYLQDKLHFLENEFRKYKDYIENISVQENQSIQQNEQFSNSTPQAEYPQKSNDIIDLILLIIIGLIVIFVMNSIFNIGKSIGARNK